MARNKFVVEVLTPDGEIFNEEVEMISTRTKIGSLGILANHAPMLAQLDPTELRLYRSESDIVRYAQAEGYLQFEDNHALVLVSEAAAADQLDAADLRTRLEEARAAVERAPADSAQRELAVRDVKRIEAFLAVAAPAGGAATR